MSTSGTVPLVDLSLGEAEVAEQLTTALTTVGFACLTNTGVWDKAKEYSFQSQSFFSQDADYKSKFKRPDRSITDNAGWLASGLERTGNPESENQRHALSQSLMKVCIGSNKLLSSIFMNWRSPITSRLNDQRPTDYKETFNMLRFIKGNPQRAPTQLDNNKCWELWDAFEQLAHKVMQAIGLGLKLQNPNIISDVHHISDPKVNGSVIRTAWYPKVNIDEVKEGQIRCGEHSDFGTISLLYADSPGLQVFNRSTGEYEDAGFVEGGIFVNLGDLLQMWSGDTLVATKHRVLIPSKEHLHESRTSVVFFCQPDDNTLIETLDGSGKYPPVTSTNWLQSRFASTYSFIK